MKGEPFRAWQPLTFGGVARFAQDWIGRLFAVGVVIALLATACVVLTAQRSWIPSIETAIARLPAGAEIRGGRLNAPETVELVENTFLAIRLDPQGTLLSHSASDLEITFEPTRIRVRSILGAGLVEYQPHWTVPLNRADMESWWGAWKPAVFGYLIAGTIAFLFASWIGLGLVYAIVPLVLALFLKKQLWPWGAYKLSIAALMPGAVFFSVGILIYGFNQIRLVELFAIWIIHFVLGWIFLIGAAFALPVKRVVGNPFENEPEDHEIRQRSKKKNPFKRE